MEQTEKIKIHFLKEVKSAKWLNDRDLVVEVSTLPQFFGPAEQGGAPIC